MWRLGLWLCLLSSTLPALAGGLSDLHGTGRVLSDYTGRGQWTVVMIWSSSCGVCAYEAPRMEAFHERHKAADAQLLGLSVDSLAGVADARTFVAEHGLSFPNLIGDPEDVQALFHDMTGTALVGTPAFLVFDPAGRLRTYQAGALDMSRLERLLQQQTHNDQMEVQS